jgi:cytoskeletal protein RodZ
MKLTRLIYTAFLSLLLGAVTLIGTRGRLYAQDQRDDAKPEQQDVRPDANKPAADDTKSPRQDEAKPAQQNEDKPTKQEDDKNIKNENDKNIKQEQSGQSAQNASRGADRGSRIPDDKFRASFGRQHTFAVHTTTVGGRPGFQYGGYSFTLVDAWPAGWAYTDQCYIDYIDGQYLLFDLAHPGVSIVLVVVM